MLIGELSKASGTSVHTIRFYEKTGLLKGKRNAKSTSNNYLHYDDEVVERLELINEAKAVGFTLSEIKKLIDAWYGNRFTLEQKMAILNEKLSDIDDRIQQLKDMRKLLKDYQKSVANKEC